MSVSPRPASAPPSQLPHHTRAEPSRLTALCVAGLVCFLTAVGSGYGAWLLFGTHDERENPGGASLLTQSASVTPTPPPPEVAATPPPEPAAVVTRAPAGELAVAGGEVALGGEDTGEPVRRELVKDFAVAETEVTNEQYREFVQATGHRAPRGWTEGEFPAGAVAEPVVWVSWTDANAYCQWLSGKIGAMVRLPTEAEWTLAAGGSQSRKYPWGDAWDDRAAASRETEGRVHAVKSYPLNRSPAGAYDMAGNVWEWTADAARDEAGAPLSENGATKRVLKGGAAIENREFISAAARSALAETKASGNTGFRYVVVR